MSNLEAWIVEQGLTGSRIAALLDGFAERLVADGMPLLRAYLALPTVNPSARVLNHTWLRGGSTLVEEVGHDREPGAFARSPLAYLLNQGLAGARWRLDTRDADSFEILPLLRRQGATDYLVRLVAFDNAAAPALRGVAVSFATDRSGGFGDDEIARIDALLPLLALSAYRIALFDVILTMLGTYVGPSAGRRVLGGEIRRGVGQSLTAALLFADLRGFTALADQAGPDLIAQLDQHLDAMVQPVLQQGGEVLKFLGDGILAAFPIDDLVDQNTACANAVAAALDACERNRQVNAGFGPPRRLDLDVALHCGEVFYGNIGTATRLDFTVIGPAVNEVSRMEGLCEELGSSILLSGEVARSCGRPTRSLGRHTLRGLRAPRELFSLLDALHRPD